MEASEGDTGQSQRALLGPAQIGVAPWGRGIKTCQDDLGAKSAQSRAILSS